MIGALVSILGTLNIIMFSGSRLPFAFSNEEQFPRIFSYVHSKFQTPTVSLLLMAVAAAVISIAWTFLTALTVAVIIRVTIYLFVCASLIMLRKKMPRQTGHYKIPFGNLVAIFGILISIWLLSAAKLIELRNAAIFLAAGIVIYVLQNNFKKRNIIRAVKE